MYSIGAYAKNLIGDAESADECRRSVREAMTDACLRCHDLQYNSYLISLIHHHRRQEREREREGGDKRGRGRGRAETREREGEGGRRARERKQERGGRWDADTRHMPLPRHKNLEIAHEALEAARKCSVHRDVVAP